MLEIREVLLSPFLMSNRKTPFTILMGWETRLGLPHSGWGALWEHFCLVRIWVKALEEYLKNNLVYQISFSSDSLVGGFHGIFSQSMGVSASAWIAGSGRTSEWRSSTGLLLWNALNICSGLSALYGGSIRGHYEHPLMPFSLCKIPVFCKCCS